MAADLQALLAAADRRGKLRNLDRVTADRVIASYLPAISSVEVAVVG
jgi:hypothetical protein